MIKIIAAAGILSLVTGGANAVTSACMASACGVSATSYAEIDLTSNCLSKISTCYGDNKVYSCMNCPTGYTRTERTTGRLAGCSNEASFYTCIENCNGCTNCTSDTIWSAANTGYQKKTTRTCNCNTCYETVAYQCAPGYYGKSTNGTSGCTRCPASGGIYGTTVAGATEITSCHIPANTTMSDDTGAYTFTSDCFYTN
ncbi:MAG: hypothetical protein K2I81_04470 [Alphaproteobacteria bacterium]|nr:hypothetical protein [Alphaproteobacteria bacterium]